MSDSGFTIRPMSVGAEIVGLAQGAERDPEVAAQLRAAWLEQGVLLLWHVDSIDCHRALRMTLAGAVRTGRYFDEDARARAPDFAD